MDGTAGKIPVLSRSTPRQPGGHRILVGRFCGSCFCFSLVERFSGLGLGLTVLAGFAASDPVVTPFPLAGFAGGRRPHAPGGRTPDPGRFQVGSGGLPTHPGLLLDAPQGPSQPAQGYDLLFFASLKTLLIPTKATALRRNQRPRASFPLAGFEVTLIGRFWVTPEGDACAPGIRGGIRDRSEHPLYGQCASRQIAAYGWIDS